MPKLTDRNIIAAKPDVKIRSLWDSEITGLGVRILPSGAKIWVYQERKRKRSLWRTLGRHPDINAKQARKQVLQIKRAPQIRTVLLICRLCRRIPTPICPSLEGRHRLRKRTHCAKKNPTLHSKTSHIQNISAPEVAKWFEALKQRGVSNAERILPVLSVMMRQAELWGYRAPNTNPCKGLRRKRRPEQPRFLKAEELARLGKSLVAASNAYPVQVNTIRLLLLTGARRGEILDLKWRDWRDHKLHLKDSKTGPRTIWLGRAAEDILHQLPRGKPDEAIFLCKPHQLATVWLKIRARAGLSHARLHDLRHSFASHAAMTGENLLTIKQLLGHTEIDNTARYAHISPESLKASIDRVASTIGKAMKASPHEQ